MLLEAARDEFGNLRGWVMKIIVTALAPDFDAVLVHHEIDHLDGALFIDRIERLEDLYRVLVDEDGRRVHVPVTMAVTEGLGRS